MTDNLVPLLTEKDLSSWLGISLPSLQRMRSRGNGPCFVRLSERRIAYRRNDVEAWLAGVYGSHPRYRAVQVWRNSLMGAPDSIEAIAELTAEARKFSSPEHQRNFSCQVGPRVPPAGDC